MSFGDFEGHGPATFAIDSSVSRFNYLRVNPQTREAEMRYHVEFSMSDGRRFVFDGTKYMQKDRGTGVAAIADVLGDYTTLYCRLTERTAAGVQGRGTAFLKFRTFENLAAVGSLAEFLASFQVTGTSDPAMQFQARMRFLGFTTEFVGREYDPLSPTAPPLESDIRAEVARGADEPDSFSTQSSTDLQAILRDAQSLPLEALANTGLVRVDFDKQRIFRDSFWKGSFAKDALLGWEERVRDAVLGNDAEAAGKTFAGGSFWKRFDAPQDGVAKGYVVNYELHAIPGLPEVLAVSYPDDHRRYFKKGDTVLLLIYKNDPYRMLYDTIKVIDAQNAIGVMHAGTFPDGVELATFVMSRQNYPFENMSVDDANALFTEPRATVPTPDGIAGNWDGHLILAPRADDTLLNQVSPVLFHADFQTSAGKTTADCKAGATAFTCGPDPASMRMLGAGALLGKWTGVAPALGDPLYFVLKR
jgi:hypothetical protein